jgi:HEAT repeat protein
VVAPDTVPEVLWPPIILDTVPGTVRVPWRLAEDAGLEAWRTDLLAVDLPDVRAWLESWRPDREPLARRVPVELASGRPRTIRLSRPGAYVLRSRGPRRSRVALVLASRVRATLTLTRNDVEVFCADAYSGEPVGGAAAKVIYRTQRRGRDTVLQASGALNASGRWHRSIVRDRFAPSVEATAIVSHHDHFAIARSRWDDAHLETDYQLSLRPRRPAYSPGQAAEVIGIYRKRRGDVFAAVGNAPVRLDLLDPDGSLAAAARTRTTAVGALSATFQLAQDAPAGRCEVVLTVEDEPAFEPRRFPAFLVERHAPEPFYLTVELSPSVLDPGEPLRLRVAATDANGQPLAGARVQVLSWGVPVAARGAPPWAYDEEPVEPRRVHVLPLRLPTEATLDEGGQLEVAWTPSGSELPATDLLCGIRVAVSHGDLGRAERVREMILLHQPPSVRVTTEETIVRPDAPVEFAFDSPLSPDDQEGVEATCALTFEDRHGRSRTHELLAAPVSAFVQRRLVARASRPGHYRVTVRTEHASSDAAVWVVGETEHVAWSGAERPLLFTERSWVRAGQPLRAVVAAPGRDAPVALTLRSGATVQRQLVDLRTGARSFLLSTDPRHTGHLEAALVQIHQGVARTGHATLALEPGGRSLDIGTHLLWVRSGEWSGRGYRVVTQDHLGSGVQSIVRAEILRPAFRGTPPVAVQRRLLQWHTGTATNEQGELRMGFHRDLLDRAYALFIDALAPDGRAGRKLMSTHNPGRAPQGEAEPPAPDERLDALVQHGLDSEAALWLAECLLERPPHLASRLPRLIADAASDAQALALLRLARDRDDVASPALATALARGEAARVQAIALAETMPPSVRPIIERVLATGESVPARRAAAEALGRFLPDSTDALASALDTDARAQVRAAAARALGHGGPGAVPKLAEAAASDDDLTVRLAIADALRRIGGAAAADALLDLAATGQWKLAAEALRALDDIAYQGTDPRLFRILRHGSGEVRVAAARLLARSGSPRAMRAVLDVARDTPAAELVRALAESQRPDVQRAMERWLDHRDPAVQLEAARALGPHEPRAPAVLRALLDTSVPKDVTDGAARTLVEWRDTTAAPMLVRLLATNRIEQGTRRAVVRAAGRLGWSQAGPALAGILWRGLATPGRLDDPEHRALWLDALRAAPGVSPIWKAEIERTVPPTPAPCLYASALNALRNDGLGEFLRELWFSPLPAALRVQTVQPYARLRGAAAADELLGLLKSPALQGPAIRALADLAAVQPLRDGLRSPSARVRAGAAAALGTLGAKQAVPTLRSLLTDDDPFVRMEAAHALAAATREPVAYTDSLGESCMARP